MSYKKLTTFMGLKEWAVKLWALPFRPLFPNLIISHASLALYIVKFHYKSVVLLDPSLLEITECPFLFFYSRVARFLNILGALTEDSLSADLRFNRTGQAAVMHTTN